MIIVRLMGGTGNQMFQYAAGRALALRHQTELCFDLAFLEDRTPREHHVFREYSLDLFQVKGRVATGADWDLGPYTTIGESHYHYDPGFARYPDRSFLIGYWQSSRYFEDVSPVIREELSFVRSMKQVDSIRREVSGCESVCINIRRGDFVDNPKSRAFHGFYGVSYVRRAVEILRSKVKNPRCFVFSDDVEWCRDHLDLGMPLTFVGHEWSGERFDAYLYLMSQCRHFIIPNSSFAWWAVWMNGNPEGRVVVSPARWFQDPSIRFEDLILDSWFRVDCSVEA